MAWTLRAAGAGDIEELAGLVSESASGILELLFGPEGVRARLGSGGLGPGLSGCVVAVEDGRVIGERLGYPVGTGSGWTIDPDIREPAVSIVQAFRALSISGTWYLSSIAVRSGHRRRGVGRELLRSAAVSALESGREEISLCVFRGQAAAIGLYSSSGFEERGAADLPRHLQFASHGPLVAMVVRSEQLLR